MRVLIFGATGMVGYGVLRECLMASDISSVDVLGRTATEQSNPKLRETLIPDLMRSPGHIEDVNLTGFDACFFCVGVSSAGMSESVYSQATYTFTTSVAVRLAKLNPGMVFVYVSGAGADSTGKSASMWARVRGSTENALLAMPFARVHIMRPAVIIPLNGAVSKTRSYRLFYRFTGPLLSLLRKLHFTNILTTEIIGQGMLLLARRGGPRAILESRDIAALVRGYKHAIPS